VRRLLLALFPAPWRARYGDEFEALLDERPLGPFDVADILLAAFDAHLHLRGLSAADHAKGFAMTLRIGGYAAISGGLLWAAGLFLSSIGNTEEIGAGIWIYLVGTVLLLVALVGLSAFQSRRHPRLVWAAFIVPAVGAGISGVGALLLALQPETEVLLGLAGWDLWFVGIVTLFVGSGLFGLTSLRTGSVSRAGSVLLVVAAVFVLVLLPVALGLLAIPWEPLISTSFLASMLVFMFGWVVVGSDAIRLHRPVTLTTPRGAS
jgi:hypothetical protein